MKSENTLGMFGVPRENITKLLISYIIFFLIIIMLYLFLFSNKEIMNLVKPITLMQYAGFFLFGLRLYHFKKFFLALSSYSVDCL